MNNPPHHIQASHSPKANPPIAAAKTAARMPIPFPTTLTLAAEPAEPSPSIGPAIIPYVESSDEVADGAGKPALNVTGSDELAREVAS